MMRRYNSLALSGLGITLLSIAGLVLPYTSLAQAPVPVLSMVGVATNAPAKTVSNTLPPLQLRPAAPPVSVPKQPNLQTKSTSPAKTIETPAVSLLVDSTVRQGEVLFVAAKVKSSKESMAQVISVVPHHLNWKGGGGLDVPLYSRGNGVWETVVPVRVDHPVGQGGVVVMDASNKALASSVVSVTSGGYAKQNITLSGGMGSLTPEPGEMEAIGKLKTDTNPTEKLWQKQLSLPVPECMNSPFGNLRYHNGKFTGNFHKGIDQRSPQGRLVKAPTDGVVKIAKTYRLHGGTVGLDHGQGLSSIYIHLSKISVKSGQRVKAGDILGQVGATGFATGPHLHWGLFVHGVPVNPTQWVQPDVC